MDQPIQGDFQPGFFHHGKAEWQAAEVLSQRMMPTNIREAMSQKPPPRRMKRMVADAQKDDRYWEKRKRNNDAARRSRENRRKLEQDIRTRLIILEEENALLRKEVSMLKTKFNLPTDQRFLSIDDNGELVAFAANAPLPRELFDFERDDDDSLSEIADSGDQDMNDQGKMSDGYGSMYGDSEAGSSRISSERSSTSPSQVSSNPSPTAEETNEDSIPMKKRRIKLELDEVERMRLSHGQPIFPQSQTPAAEPPASPNNSQYYSYQEHISERRREQQQQVNYENFPHQPLQASVERALNVDRRGEQSHVRSVGPVGFYPPYIRQSSQTSGEEREESREEQHGASPRIVSSQTQEIISRRDSCVSNDSNGHPTFEHSAYGDNVNSFGSAQQRETEELRSRLRMLSEEVAKMKNYVMKDK